MKANATTRRWLRRVDVKVVCVVVWWMHKVVTMVDVKVIGMVMIMVARKVTVVNAKLISMADVQRWLHYRTQRCLLMRHFCPRRLVTAIVMKQFDVG